MSRSERPIHVDSRGPAGSPRSLAHLSAGASGRICRIGRDLTGRADRLGALGVTVGATIRVLQTFPGIVFECDQTELAVERTVAGAIFVHVSKSRR
jgi:Fe2+ transport system protein FeoA